MSGMQVTVAGNLLPDFMAIEVVRDLTDIAGSIMIDYDDQARYQQGLAPLGSDAIAATRPIMEDDEIEVTIDGDLVMRGWVDDVHLSGGAEGVRCSITGRDVTCDLVDCSVEALGPYEYRQLSLTDITTRLGAPYGITVTADCDVGDPFKVVALEAGEPVMGAIEKLARQRGVLVTSNGIGGVVLTQAGTTRAPGSIVLPGNVRDWEVVRSGRDRYSDVWVLGQWQSNQRPGAPTLSAAQSPAALQTPSPGTRTMIEGKAITAYGHVIDPAIARHRPVVFLACTNSGSSVAAENAPVPVEQGALQAADPLAAAHRSRRSHRRQRRQPMKPRTDASPWTLQDQASWRLRTMRARAQRRNYVVTGWRAGADDALWLPNSLVDVDDLYCGITGDQLISAVAYLRSEDGARTRLSVSDPDAFDLTGDDDNANHAGRRRARHARATDASARRYR